jgi:hypothetical protein
MAIIEIKKKGLQPPAASDQVFASDTAGGRRQEAGGCF